MSEHLATEPATTGRRREAHAVFINDRKANLTDDPFASPAKKTESQQLADPFTNEYVLRSDLQILEPPYDPAWLSGLPEISPTLGPSIQTMKVNVDSWGHVLDYIGKAEDEENDKAAQQEKIKLTSFFKMPNPYESLVTLRLKLRHDMEAVGYGFIEITRSVDGEIAMMFHVPAPLVRLTALERDPYTVTVSIERDGKMVELPFKRRFRRFVMMRGTRKVFFKEFGDPRKILARTGKEVSKTSLGPKGNGDGQANLADLATEILYFSAYNGRSEYGVPKYAGALFSVLGNRKSEELNYRFFKDNGIPPMVVMISGGQLTPTSMEEMKKQFQGGVEVQQKVLVLEAVSTEGSIEDRGLVKIEMKPLGLERQSDATFQTYDIQNQKKTKGSFRLPSIFLGGDDSYNYATSVTARAMGESQVFRPERVSFDEVINMQILRDMKIKSWQFRTIGPPIDPDQAIQGMNAIANLGALTVNDAIEIGTELFALPLQPVKEDWGNLPFQMVLGLLGQGKLAGLEQFEKETDPLDALSGLFGGPGPKQVPTKLPVGPDGKPVGSDGEPEEEDATLEKVQKGLSVVHGLLALRRAVQQSLNVNIRKGGPGSGNFGHAGRPGEVGGSAPGEGGSGDGGRSTGDNESKQRVFDDTALRQKVLDDRLIGAIYQR